MAGLSWRSCSWSGSSLGLASARGWLSLAALAPRGRGGGRLPGCAASCPASAMSWCQPGQHTAAAPCSSLQHGPSSMCPRLAKA